MAQSRTFQRLAQPAPRQRANTAAQAHARQSMAPHPATSAASQRRVDPAPHALSSLPVQRRGALPARLQAGLERLSGLNLSDVRVHSNSSQPSQLQALAYARGNEIHLGPGQERHLPHEAWHLVQQRQGRVRPTMQLHGTPINDDESLEREADQMGERALKLGA